MAIEEAREKGVAYDLAYRIVMPDESVRYIHSISIIRKNENNQVVTLFGTGQDITAAKLTQERIEQLSQDNT